ncbi:hypothetical protein D1AOALGA4SA_4318 [Olavius algarvensis Delta 1 endosymbiont]|nr:hypothetical protein D1AOALGA4SA_4318 [Olavius algarvensis Delta 1 endosymbiont]
MAFVFLVYFVVYLICNFIKKFIFSFWPAVFLPYRLTPVYDPVWSEAQAGAPEI